VTAPEPAVPERLLADLAGLSVDHPIDAGVLGEYAQAARSAGPDASAEAYPRVAAHLRGGCDACEVDLAALDALARRAGPRSGPLPEPRPAAPPDPRSAAPADEAAVAAPAPSAPSWPPEPIEIASAVALARAIEAEHEALRAPLRPDRFGEVDTRRAGARRRNLLLVEAGLARQRLVARRLFVDRISATLAPRRGAGDADTARAERTRPVRPLNPKARLMLDDLAGQVDDLGRLVGRLGRILTDLHRLGSDPRGPARPRAEALTERGLGLTREALALDRRLARLQGPLSGMAT
jgi:hypothetical protein